MTRLTGALTEASYDASVQAAAASEQIRGYEGVKLANVGRYRTTLAALDLV